MKIKENFKNLSRNFEDFVEIPIKKIRTKWEVVETPERFTSDTFNKLI